jgi:hypothetical protein
MCQGDDTIIKLPPDERVYRVLSLADQCGLRVKNPESCIGTGLTHDNIVGAKFLKKYFNQDLMPT